jgi:hypothetical protein
MTPHPPEQHHPHVQQSLPSPDPRVLIKEMR